MDTTVARCEELRDQVRSFVERYLVDVGARLEAEQAIPRDVLSRVAAAGYLGAAIRRRFGGLELSAIDKLTLHTELPRVHGSLQNMVTVAGMAAVPVQRFAPRALAEDWLPAMARGERFVAFAVTEPSTGSSLSHVQTRVEEQDGELVLHGEKCWISFAQLADAFLVLARAGEEETAVLLVERTAPGLTIERIDGMLGLRANMLGRLRFDGCRVPRDHLLGRPSKGVAAPVLFGLDEGRFTTACGSLGIAEASLALALDRVRERSQGGRKLYEYQLVQKLITEMVVAVKAARLLCRSAAESRDRADADMIEATLIAKYHASRTACQVANDALQLFGAQGCQQAAGIERLFRDARMMEIIEGTSQVHEVQIALSHLKSTVPRGAP